MSASDLANELGISKTIAECLADEIMNAAKARRGLARYAPPLRAGSLLLLNSSIGAVETRLEAALRRPRAVDAARRVVGAAGALLFAPPAVLLVQLWVVGGGLGRVGALHGARGDQ